MLPQKISQFLTQLATCLVRGEKKVMSPFSNVGITFAHFQIEENRTQILSRECDQEIIPLYCLSIM